MGEEKKYFIRSLAKGVKIFLSNMLMDPRVIFYFT